MEAVKMAQESAHEKAAKNLRKKSTAITAKDGYNNSFKPSSARSSAHSVTTTAPSARTVGREREEYMVENTYKMSPDRKFPGRRIENVIKETLEEFLEDVSYEPEICRELSKTICDHVKEKVKRLQLPRYKLVSLVHIGQIANQGMRIGSRCLWDMGLDNYASFEYKNGSVFAVGTVYGVYYE